MTIVDQESGPCGDLANAHSSLLEGMYAKVLIILSEISNEAKLVKPLTDASIR